jgi:hypothetical protein
MEFNLNKSCQILARTPMVLKQMLSGLDESWIKNNEGENTWSPFDVVGHLIHGEKTDWIPRMEMILSDNTDKNFIPFDRFAQLNEKGQKTLDELLDEFSAIRKKNLAVLESKKISDADLLKKGIHPAFGEVTLEQLLATWVVHDLNHIVQIARVMARQYAGAVGPWTQYLSVLTR